MNLQNLNQKFVVTKTALLKKHEREYLQSFIDFKTQHDSDKALYKDSRKNVLAIIEKSKGNTIAINVDDVYDATERAKSHGAKVIREAGPMNGGETICAFLEDPNGYEIELLSKKF